jgi:hypothetical protein
MQTTKRMLCAAGLAMLVAIATVRSVEAQQQYGWQDCYGLYETVVYMGYSAYFVFIDHTPQDYNWGIYEMWVWVDGQTQYGGSCIAPFGHPPGTGY